MIDQQWPVEIGIRHNVLTRSRLIGVIDRIEYFGTLPVNWDGEGANSIHLQTVANCQALLESALDVLPVPEVDPNSNGTISFEWATADGFAHLEVGRTLFGLFIESEGTLVHTERASVSQSFVGTFRIIASYLYPGLTYPTFEFRNPLGYIPQTHSDTLLAGVFENSTSQVTFIASSHLVRL